MSNFIPKPFLFLSIFFFLPIIYFPRVLADGEITKKDIMEWCTTTPHPKSCNYFMNRAEGSDPITNQDFRTLTIQVAMECAIDAQNQATKLGYHGNGRRLMITEDSDCNSLVDYAIIQLNNTLHSIRANSTHTEFDRQTWLSAALTNIEICKLGFGSSKTPKLTSPIMTGNVSELIRNSLAANGALDHVKMNGNDYEVNRRGFPGWMAAGDRKLLQSPSLKSRAAAVVSQDGSGQFTSIQAAIEYAVSKRVGSGRAVVYVKKGVYTENILINRTMDNVLLVGDGVLRTIISGNLSSSAGFTTYSSATVGIDGGGFMARGITFRNTAGPEGGQAVALRSASDLSVFYACSFEGYQDTLFVQAQRQFFKLCYIYGTVDFIFGNAAAVFQNCVIYARKPVIGQANSITAQGRGDPFQNTGISIQYCRILAAPELKPFIGTVKTYLGRPWQEYSRTVVMKSYIDDLVAPEGWSPWDDSGFALGSLYYGEYQNFGPGAGTESRVNWTGYHVITDPNEVSGFTVSGLIAGRGWLPATGVPFIAGV